MCCFKVIAAVIYIHKKANVIYDLYNTRYSFMNTYYNTTCENGVAVSVETILKLGLMNRATQCTTTEPTNLILYKHYINIIMYIMCIVYARKCGRKLPR